MITASTGSVRSNWIARARGFLDAAEKLAKDPESYAPAFELLIWQASELSLKSLTADHNIVFTHDPKEVMDHLKANNILDRMTYNLLQSNVVTVTGSASYAELRYPSENRLYWENISPQETKIRLDAARTIVEICQVRGDAQTR